MGLLDLLARSGESHERKSVTPGCLVFHEEFKDSASTNHSSITQEYTPGFGPNVLNLSKECQNLKF